MGNIQLKPSFSVHVILKIDHTNKKTVEKSQSLDYM